MNLLAAQPGPYGLRGVDHFEAHDAHKHIKENLMSINETHDPKLRSFVESANDAQTDFPIQNLPLAVFRRRGMHELNRIGAAIGDRVLDIYAARHLLGQPAQAAATACGKASMADLMALEPTHWSQLRLALSHLLRAGSVHEIATLEYLVAMDKVEFALPMQIPNFTDYLASIHHISNMVRIKRPQSPEIPAAFIWTPLGYNGRATTIRPDGHSFVRPNGQTGVFKDGKPVFGPTGMLDYEAELGVYIARSSPDGAPLDVDAAEDMIFGLSVLNDWTARDIQGWEATPLGPYQGKSFVTTISPWIVMMEALEPFREAWSRAQEHPQPLPNLDTERNRARGGIDIRLEVLLETPQTRAKGMAPVSLGRSKLGDCYWSLAQLVAHQTANGAGLIAGDLIGTGTVSGPGDDEAGCMFELTAGGKKPVTLPTGELRGFIEDKDSVVIRAWCEALGWRRLGFGAAQATVLAG